MIRKILVFPLIFFFLLLGLATLYLVTGNSDKNTPNLSIENARLRLPAPGQTTAAAFFDIINVGGADELLSATSPVSENIEIHTHLHEDGVLKMRKVETVKIQAFETTAFKSGGKHIMLFDVNIPDGTKSIPLVLTFARTGDKRVLVIIN